LARHRPRDSLTTEFQVGRSSQYQTTYPHYGIPLLRL